MSTTKKKVKWNEIREQTKRPRKKARKKTIHPKKRFLCRCPRYCHIIWLCLLNCNDAHLTRFAESVSLDSFACLREILLILRSKIGQWEKHIVAMNDDLQCGREAISYSKKHRFWWLSPNFANQKTHGLIAIVNKERTSYTLI